MTDRELLRFIEQKDSGSFKTLYDRYCNRLNGWAYSRLKDKEIAADLMQEFWMSIWLTPQNIRLDEQDSARQSLLRNLSFRVLKYFHKQSVCLEISDDEIVARQIPALYYTHVREDLNVKEIQQLIDEVLHSLPDLQQKIYELRCLGDCSVKETASRLGIAESSVRNGLSSVRLSLREKLELCYEIEGRKEFGVVLSLILLLGKF